ncbi:protein of unknown function (plasmid) [Cupriavidus taiwanensis]|uniref:Uncharacterized protein n=1 Tax=Cupriavidus taiwanensis TaxID=164546 RepID=A0A375EGA4_9BURK|nr:protein of unknown function [Cupriavidus taiwanensis]SOZ74484.1 protein of unknown function [Cupriavidus taiwanensis]SPA03373.1 protein of unknown function [Cupriavidus taiwanensis]SPA11400.1 protein of unknown function [Cupriavidus taiwanensis]SPA57114.1 protein of unknown function [Cupriavidus taiwanensis]
MKTVSHVCRHVLLRLAAGAGVEEATSLNAWRQFVKACRSSHLDGDGVGHCGATAQ